MKRRIEWWVCFTMKHKKPDVCLTSLWMLMRNKYKWRRNKSQAYVRLKNLKILSLRIRYIYPAGRTGNEESFSTLSRPASQRKQERSEGRKKYKIISNRSGFPVLYFSSLSFGERELKYINRILIDVPCHICCHISVPHFLPHFATL